MLQNLGLTPTGTTPILTPSTGGQPVDAAQYDVSLFLFHQKATMRLGTVAVIESELEVQGFQVLVGRDVLENCLLVYDGQTGIFTLAF